MNSVNKAQAHFFGGSGEGVILKSVENLSSDLSIQARESNDKTAKTVKKAVNITSLVSLRCQAGYDISFHIGLANPYSTADTANEGADIDTMMNIISMPDEDFAWVMQTNTLGSVWVVARTAAAYKTLLDCGLVEYAEPVIDELDTDSDAMKIHLNTKGNTAFYQAFCDMAEYDCVKAIDNNFMEALKDAIKSAAIEMLNKPTH